MIVANEPDNNITADELQNQLGWENLDSKRLSFIENSNSTEEGRKQKNQESENFTQVYSNPSSKEAGSSTDTENQDLKKMFNNKSAFMRTEEQAKQKQLLFTSTKNKKNKKNNFQIIKTENGTECEHKKDVYYELLLSAAESFLERGIVSLEEIYLNSDCNEDSRKCDNRTCTASGPKKHHMWSRVKHIKSNKPMCLCSDCFKAYKAGQFCFYCSTIYRDDINDYLYTWIQCDYCELWHHLHCEESKGDYPNIAKLIQDPNFKYMCLPCRNKNQKPKRKYKEKEKLLGQKTKGEPLSLEKSNKRKEAEVNVKGYSNFAMLNPNDSRDIYHDFYKIANLKGIK